MIKIDKLSVSYRKNLPYVISNLDFEIESGCILNILGQNAVGKTTFIKALTRELIDYKGTILIDGTDAKEYSINDFAKKVGVVSTSNNTFQNLLVADYLVTGFINQLNPFSAPGVEHVQKAHEVLKNLGKDELFNKSLDQLSSGEKQIVMIARVLLQNPEIIIFDEPTANLDVKNQIVVLNYIKKLSSMGYTIIVTTHNPRHAYCMGGKTLIMGKGKYNFGNTEEIITKEILSEYYELEVRMLTVEKTKCMFFQNGEDEVQLIF